MGIFLSAGIFSAVETLSQNPFSPVRAVVKMVFGMTPIKSTAPAGPRAALVAEEVPSLSPPAHGKAVRIDLENGSITLYENGNLFKNFSAVAVPDEFSLWRVPQGVYPVRARAEEHYSSLAGSSFPYAILFSDNGLIYGAEKNAEQTRNRRGTDAEDTAEVFANRQAASAGAAAPKKDAGAGIALKAEDAAVLFDFADAATEVIVLNEIPESRVPRYEDVLSGGSALPHTTPRISARAALAADLDTGKIFFEKSPDLVLPIASISKLFTAVIAEELLSPEKIVRISSQSFATYGGSGELSVGDTFSAQELLYPLLLESSNDVAEAFAEEAGREKFIAAMNALAGRLGLPHTSFKDPSGLSSGNIGTARDLFRFAQFLLSASSGEKEHADILAISKTSSFEAPANDLRAWARTWRNNNEFVRDGNPYLIGTKNGYTDEAAQTTVSLFALPISETKERRVAVVLLGSNNREGDARALLKESGKGTLYGNADFADEFRKKAEEYALEKEKQAPEFRLAIVGVPSPEDLPQDVSRIFDAILYLKSYDAIFANVEGIIADTGYNVAGEDAVRAPRDLLSALATLGVDVVNVANAHAGDWGRGAFGDNMRLLEESGISVAGGSDGAASKGRPVVIERGGVKVGFLSFSDSGPEWLAEDDYLPSLLSAKDPSFEKRINNAARDVDHLVVGIAFGGRETALSQERKVELAHRSIDAGARAVVWFSPSENAAPEPYHGGLVFYGQKNFDPEEMIFDKKSIKGYPVAR